MAKVGQFKVCPKCGRLSLFWDGERWGCDCGYTGAPVATIHPVASDANPDRWIIPGELAYCFRTDYDVLVAIPMLLPPWSMKVVAHSDRYFTVDYRLLEVEDRINGR